MRAVTTVRLAVASDNSLSRPHARTLGFDVVANCWMTDVIGTTVGAALKQGRSGAYDTVVYRAGARFCFDRFSRSESDAAMGLNPGSGGMRLVPSSHGNRGLGLISAQGSSWLHPAAIAEGAFRGGEA